MGNRLGPSLGPRVFILATVGCFSCLPLTDQQQVVCGVFINKKLMRNIAIDVLHIGPDLARETEAFRLCPVTQPGFPDNNYHSKTAYFTKKKRFAAGSSIVLWSGNSFSKRSAVESEPVKLSGVRPRDVPSGQGRHWS